MKLNELIQEKLPFSKPTFNLQELVQPEASLYEFILSDESTYTQTHYSANSFLCAHEVDERFSKNFPSTAFWLKEYQINNILQLIILLEKFSHRYMMWSLHLEPQMLKQSIAQHSPKTAKLLEYSAQHAEKQLDPGYI